MLERYLIPLAPYALLALAAIAGLVVFSSVDREIRRLKSRLGQQLVAETERENTWQSRLDNLDSRLRETGERVRAPLRLDLNRNRRNQALRMFRRGDGTASIAASLNMPRNEVELLRKVHQLTLDSGPEAAA